MNSDRKVAEAKEHIDKAEKCLKTGFFKWKPDLDGAAAEYTKAATCYRNVKMYKEAKDMYIKTAQTQRQMLSLFHAAKSYEQAALLCKEMKDYDQAADLMDKASLIFLESGTQDTAALSLEKAGKMLEKTCPERAVLLYKRAADVVQCEERPRQAADFIRQYSRLLIRLKRLEEAVVGLQKEISLNAADENYELINKIVVGLVLVHLTRGDYVAANKQVSAAMCYPNFGDSEECMILSQLLDAYDQCDEDTASGLLRKPFFKHLDNDFAKLARDLKVPGGGGSAVVNDPSGGSTEPAADDNEEELDLC